MRKLLFAVALIAMAMIAIAPSASAVPLPPTLSLSTAGASGGFSVVIADNLAGDTNAALGVVTFSTTAANELGSAWTVSVTTGISDPALHPPGGLDLISVQVSSASALNDVLTIEWSNPFVNIPFGPPLRYVMNIGGTINTIGPVNYTAYQDAADVVFGTTNLIGTLGPFSGNGPFGGTTSKEFPAMPATYSLMQQVTITANGAGTISFDAELTPSPEPSTMLLIGLGLIGGAAFGRRRLARR